MTAILLSSGAAWASTGKVYFKVRRSPLRVRIVRPRHMRKSRRYVIKAVIKNAGRKRLTKTHVSIKIKPKLRPKAAKKLRVRKIGTIKARRSKTVKWKVFFPRAKTYRITVVASARQKKQILISGRRTRFKVLSVRSWRRRFRSLVLSLLRAAVNQLY